MDKNLIIGGFTRYGINELKPWVLSAKEHGGENCDVVLCAGETTEETTKWLEEQGVIVFPMAKNNSIPIHVYRFLYIYEYLRNFWANYHYVVVTDVKDVYFQKSPFDFFETAFDSPGNLSLVIAGEALRYQDEPWGNDNLFKSYGPYVHGLFKNMPIYNVGTFGGRSDYVMDMVFHIFTNAINRPIPICDQAVFNVLINTQPFKSVVVPSYHWACEAGTVADPTKINDFRPNLLCPEPVFQDGLVKTHDQYVYPIVHQYDRVPEWKKFVQEKFGQQDDSGSFIYKV